jgi:hypothetical protein
MAAILLGKILAVKRTEATVRERAVPGGDLRGVLRRPS